jgi:hypothetical protein
LGAGHTRKVFLKISTKTALIILLILINPITGYFLGELTRDGVFRRWESIGSPPEKPIRIVAGQVRDASTTSIFFGKVDKGREIIVYVETELGHFYQCCSKTNSMWSPVESSNIEEINWLDCALGDRKHLEDEIDNYAIYWCGEFDYGRAYFAIRQDGTVWLWKHYGRFPDEAIPICGYPIIGLIVMVIILRKLKRISMDRFYRPSFLFSGISEKVNKIIKARKTKDSS